MSDNPPTGTAERAPGWMKANDLLQYGVHRYAAAVVRWRDEENWPADAMRIADASLRARPARARHGVQRIERVFPDRPPGGASAVELMRRITAAHVQETMLYARLSQRPSWRPTLRLHGQEHLDEALAEGRGAVLWSVHQIATSLLVRLALHDVGRRVHHLSHWSHGPSSTRVGQFVLARAHKRVEERIAERVIITPDGPLGALRELGRTVRSGGVVSIRGLGMSDAAPRFALFGGKMLLALGAPRTARLAKAPLLSVHGRRDGDGGWSVTLRPLRSADATESVEATAERFCEVVAEAIVAAPELWPVLDRHYLDDD